MGVVMKPGAHVIRLREVQVASVCSVRAGKILLAYTVNGFAQCQCGQLPTSSWIASSKILADLSTQRWRGLA